MGVDDWWRDYFDADFLRIYEDFLTPARTHEEVAGILALLQLPPRSRLLDLACGWGRHSVALAEAGMDVTAVDLSETLLERAKRDAAEAGVEVEWVRADMREIGWDAEFDGVLSLFSSLGLFGSDEEDQRVLRAAHRSLRPAGVILLEVMHRDQVVAEYAERDRWETGDGTQVRMRRTWDPVAGISLERLRWRRGAERGEKMHRIRVRSATEWAALLRASGFAPLAWWGSWEGAPFARDSEQMIVLARAES